MAEKVNRAQNSTVMVIRHDRPATRWESPDTNMQHRSTHGVLNPWETIDFIPLKVSASRRADGA